jgi:hypothetical protein
MQWDRLLYHLSHRLVGSAPPRKRQIALTIWRLKAHSASRAVVPALALCDGGPVHDRVEFRLPSRLSLCRMIPVEEASKGAPPV